MRQHQQRLYQFQFKAMACNNQLICYSAQSPAIVEQLFHTVQAEIARIENRYSRYRPTSLISTIQQRAGVGATPIDTETYALLNYANSCFQLSDGQFDISSGVLRRAWDFNSGTLPTQQTINALLPLIGWNRVEWDETHCFLPKAGMELDLGGIGKEYAADRAAAILKTAGIESALINLGGDIRALGPHPDGKPWQIGIPQPNREDSQLSATLSLYRGGIATSGDYERSIEINGKHYSHILNPQTGWPVEDSFRTVSVIADHCLAAGSTATIAMLAGREAGELWLQQQSVTYHTQ